MLDMHYNDSLAHLRPDAHEHSTFLRKKAMRTLTMGESSKWDAAVAQWIEYWPPKPRVVGSIPASRTK